jgi:hypothetical protein
MPGVIDKSTAQFPKYPHRAFVNAWAFGFTRTSNVEFFDPVPVEPLREFNCRWWFSRIYY